MCRGRYVNSRDLHGVNVSSLKGQNQCEKERECMFVGASRKGQHMGIRNIVRSRIEGNSAV